MVGKDQFLGGGNLYDDDGALVVGLPFEFKRGIYTEHVHTVTGAITAMYDSNIATYYKTVSDAVERVWFKWDFKRKINFKNIYAYVTALTSHVTIQGSNDNTNWHTLSNIWSAGAGAAGNITATDVKYRYIRINGEPDGGNPQLTVYTVEGVV